MEFKRYPSIENSYRQKFLDKIKEEGHSEEEFVVQEKIHGGSLTFCIDSEECKVAKRSNFIKKGEKFFNYQKVRDLYLPKLRECFNYLKSKDGNIEDMAIYGELYGGVYPHSDVPKSQDGKVQKEIYYSPDQDFIAFDIKINGIFQDVIKANVIFDLFNIPYAKTLFTGPLEECLKYPNSFQTTIPKEKGLPEIENNICEGVVIRPIKPIFMWSHERLILKNKNDKFSEKERPVKEPKIMPTLDQKVQEVLDKAILYINENRLKNVLSKIGTVSKEDFGKIIQSFTKDAIEDFMKDEREIFEMLEKTDQKLITKKIGEKAAKLLRNNFLNVVDGNF